MSRHKYFIFFITSFILNNNVFCKDDENILQKIDQCTQICNDNFFLLPIVSDTKDVCERGCRLFNLIDAKESSNTNKSKVACHASCNEAYVSPNFDACIIGCNEMEKKRVVDLSTNSFFVYVEQEGSNNVMVVQPELEQIDLDILADPGFRKQLVYQLEYKIPETHIRTMPINSNLDEFGIPSDIQMKQIHDSSSDWLDCAARNSGIPKFVLISAILIAILIAAWLITAQDKRELMPPPDLLDDENCYHQIHDPPPVYTEKYEKFNLETEKV